MSEATASKKRPAPHDEYQFSVSVLFTERQLRELTTGLGEPVAQMRNQDGGTTATHGTSCDGGTCQLDK